MTLGNRMNDFEFEIISGPEEEIEIEKEEVEPDDYDAWLESQADAILSEIQGRP